MATEILLNDGGAPARILPFTAGSTVTAGLVVTMSADDSKVDHAGSGTVLPLGVSFTSTTSGNIANVITGRGVMLNVSCSSAVTMGDALEVGSTAGELQTAVATEVGRGQTQAVALETTAGKSYAKVLWR